VAGQRAVQEHGPGRGGAAQRPAGAAQGADRPDAVEFGYKAQVLDNDDGIVVDYAVEHGRGFRRLVKWRIGCEGRISCLKRGYGWDRTRLDGRHGAAIWCGHGVFTHNLVKIATLAG